MFHRIDDTIYNEGPGDIYVLLGPGEAGPERYTVRVEAGWLYRLPLGYVGEVSIWPRAPKRPTIWERLNTEDGS